MFVLSLWFFPIRYLMTMGTSLWIKQLSCGTNMAVSYCQWQLEATPQSSQTRCTADSLHKHGSLLLPVTTRGNSPVITDKVYSWQLTQTWLSPTASDNSRQLPSHHRQCVQLTAYTNMALSYCQWQLEATPQSSQRRCTADSLHKHGCLPLPVTTRGNSPVITDKVYSWQLTQTWLTPTASDNSRQLPSHHRQGAQLTANTNMTVSYCQWQLEATPQSSQTRCTADSLHKHDCLLLPVTTRGNSPVITEKVHSWQLTQTWLSPTASDNLRQLPSHHRQCVQLTAYTNMTVSYCQWQLEVTPQSSQTRCTADSLHKHDCLLLPVTTWGNSPVITDKVYSWELTQTWLSTC